MKKWLLGKIGIATEMQEMQDKINLLEKRLNNEMISRKNETAKLKKCMQDKFENEWKESTKTKMESKNIECQTGMSEDQFEYVKNKTLKFITNHNGCTFTISSKESQLL